MSSWAELAAWRRERFPALAWLPLALFVASASGPALDPLGVLRALALALGLLLQFRLWDDLADRTSDAREHPGRVLVRATRLLPFQRALLACGAANTALAAAGARPADALGSLAILTALYLAWYAGLRDRVAAPLVRAHLQVLKYGVMVLVVSDRPFQPPALVALGAALVWFAFCTHELLHEERLRARPKAPVLLALDAGLLLAAGAFAAANVSSSRAGGAVASALLAACGIALAIAVARVWRGRAPGALRYAPLVLGLAQALSLAALE